MSDTKSNQSVENRNLQMMVEGIAKKINGAPALNGGFDRMMVIVEHIQEKQEETTKKIDKIHEGLYEPDEGLYARVKTVEGSAVSFAEKQMKHFTSDEKNLSDINASLKTLSNKDEELEAKAETIIKLQKIAGEDLEKLESVIKVKSTWLDASSRIFWLLAGGALAAIGKTVWETIFHR